jgi:serine/threonine protein kinase
MTSAFGLDVAHDVAIRDGTLYLTGDPVERYEISSKIAEGNNGVVFKARHKVLEIPAAIKVWLKLSPGDTRDKAQQGLDEARRMARAHRDWVAQIYDGDLVKKRLFYACMEFVPGETLDSIPVHSSD